MRKEKTPPPNSKLRYHVKRKGKSFHVIENGGDYQNKVIHETSDKKEAYRISKIQSKTQQWAPNAGVPLYLCPTQVIQQS
jgi:hypothetical protein|tara:strand:- start:3615 stop:3854 length:240 start_codon:yes stop_codon:yes gene_type:complete